MSRSTYAGALNRALQPLGFERQGDDWVRVQGEIWHCVNRQSSWLGGVTVNLHTKDVQTEKLFLEIFGPRGAIQMPPPCWTRIGALIGPLDRWWTKDESNGPQDMAEAVLVYGLPWFGLVASLEDELEAWYPSATAILGFSEPGLRPALIGLALTLHRLGRHDDACKVVSRRPRRRTPEAVIADCARVRDWLGCGSRNRAAAPLQSPPGDDGA